MNEILGFILNVPTDYKLGLIVLPLKRRHWIAVRKIGDQFYNLDSKLDSPQCIGSDENLLNYLRSQLQSKDKELFIIVRSDIEKAKIWLKDNTGKNNIETLIEK